MSLPDIRKDVVDLIVEKIDTVYKKKLLEIRNIIESEGSQGVIINFCNTKGCTKFMIRNFAHMTCSTNELARCFLCKMCRYFECEDHPISYIKHPYIDNKLLCELCHENLHTGERILYSHKLHQYDTS